MSENEKQNFQIKTADFKGPFSMLLEMIKKRKLSINEISLSKITDEYINYLKENEFKLAEASYFVQVASTLLLIKSKSLLPKLSLNKEEEEDIDQLQKRLRFLKEIKNASSILKEHFGKNILKKKIFKNKTEIKFRPNENISLKNILTSLDNLVKKSPFKEEIPEKKVQKQLPLKLVIEQIQNKIKRFLKINFSELILSPDKKDISVSFLAILELFKNEQINITQQELFGEITVEYKNQNND